ncbi:MAG: hypothetical protein OEY10_00145 [Nitrosopumilus sp.]|nr:hypothetical protein [Nitrosopumilus sp.]
MSAINYEKLYRAWGITATVKKHPEGHKDTWLISFSFGTSNIICCEWWKIDGKPRWENVLTHYIQRINEGSSTSLCKDIENELCIIQKPYHFGILARIVYLYKV